jgi:abequosyltransferase
MEEKQPLLTIAIPTYNRASLLDRCLSQLCKQLRGKGGEVELIISNNASSDGTEEIVKKYLASGAGIKYVRNGANIGPDNNFIQCFKMARGKYVLLFGDDDIFLDGAIGKIIDLLQKDNYGIVYLNSYPFLKDPVSERTKASARGFLVYTDTLKFIKKAHYFLTFISGNIVNKTRVDPGLNFESFVSTNLIQLSWTLSALFNSEKNAYVAECLFATQLSDARTYRLSQVFGRNFNQVARIFLNQGVDEKFFQAIHRKLVSNYFPANIVRQRKGMIDLEPEDYFRSLYPLYGQYLSFWIFTCPAIYLPLPAAYFLFATVQKMRECFLSFRSRLSKFATAG